MPLNETFKNKWIAKNVPPPSPDHWRLFHLTTAEFGISDIALGRLKVARFSDLNDPFELMALKFIKRYEGIISEFKEAYDRQAGLLCFSADWANPVLWSHYGDKHRGMCLGFDIPETLAEKVDYEDKRIIEQLEQLRQGHDLLRDENLKNRLRRTKYKDWDYEEEYRVFVPLEEKLKEGTLYFYPFGDNLRLIEVILGPRCILSLDAVQRLVRTQHPHAVTFQARPARQHYSIVPKDS